MPGSSAGAFEQVKKALRGMFIRKKPRTQHKSAILRPDSRHLSPPKRPTSAPLLDSASDAPECATPPATEAPRSAPKRASRSMLPNSGYNSPASSEPLSFRRRPPTPASPNEPRELSSSPRSPPVPSQFLEGSFTTKPLPPVSVEVKAEVDREAETEEEEEAKPEAEEVSAKDPAPSHHESLEQQDHYEDYAHVSTSYEAWEVEDEARSAEEPIQALSDDDASVYSEMQDYESMAERFETESVSHSTYDKTPEATDLEPLPKRQSGMAVSNPSGPFSATADETPHANGAARRAPPIYHDEKIPVMAEPPQVRQISIAPGMVATSGPLEDFPFR